MDERKTGPGNGAGDRANGHDGGHPGGRGLAKWQPVFTGLIWLVGFVLLYLALKYVAPYFTPFIIALGLAILINPTVNGLEDRLHIPRGWAVALTLFFFFGLVLGLVLFGVGAIVVQLGQLAQDLPSHYAELVDFVESLVDRASEAFSGLPADFISLTESTIRSSLQSVYLGLQTLLRALINGLAGLPATFLVGVISLVATFFISRDKDLIMDFLLSLLPAAYRERVVRVNRNVVASAVGLIKAQLTLVSISLAIMVFGLYVLGVHYAWLVGLVVGLLDVLPAVGPATVLVPWAIYSLFNHDTTLGIGLLILVGVISVFRQVLEPRIVGERIGLHPLLTLLALYLGIRLLGAAGLLVGPLVAIIIKAIVQSNSPPPPRRRLSTRRPASSPAPRGVGSPPGGSGE